ncbi:glycosyltransferase family 2 protein [Flavobacterium sp. 83]|uniref:glycosyltransferase family 2 protein n=1 Tax=Flavobacterium sp. 83 TaxID=1131812 RepID=UPI00068CE362|nr:glycosyltransferase family 2 protein [Flavobacterium sp. 83]
MFNPLVSIIVPCYNQGQYLNEAIQSVLDQTYFNWECIIVNDGSTDNTEQIALEWREKDTRFIYYYKENGGLSTARNFGLNKVKGDYIQFLDSDDCLDSRKFEKSMYYFNLSKNKDVKIVISNFKMFDNDMSKLSDPYCNLNLEFFNFESLLYQWEDSFTIPIHCGMFETSLFYYFRFPENLKAKEDWVMWVSLFQKKYEAIFNDEFLAFYRKNPNSMTKSKNLLPDFLKAIECFNEILTPKQYNRLAVVLISRFYISNLDYKNKFTKIKDSNTYKLGLFLKKIAKKIYLLPFFKKIFKSILNCNFISKRI